MALSQARPREGSTLYYTLLYTPEDKARAIINLLDLSNTLANTLHDVTDPAVAEKKIHWWHEEISRLYAGEARHPSTQAASETIQYYAIDQTCFWSILEANNSVKFSNATTDQTFIERLNKDYGARLQMCLQVFQAPDTDLTSQSIQTDGYVWGLGTFDLLTQFRKLHNRAYPVWPDSDYLEADLEPAKVNNDDQKENTKKLLSRRMEFSAEQLRQALDVNERCEHPGALPLRILATLRTAQLAHWKRRKIRPNEKYVTLTPVRKAWLAWRCKQRHQQIFRRSG